MRRTHLIAILSSLCLAASAVVPTGAALAVGVQPSPAKFRANGFAPMGIENWEIAAGDLNGDGKTDLVSTGGMEDTITVSYGEGGGRFAEPFSLSGDNVFNLDIADVDDDGFEDLIVSDETVKVFLWGPSGVAETVTLSNSTARGDVVAGHVDDDEHLDLVFSAALGGAQVRFGRGDGTFDLAQSVVTGAVSDIALEDFDGDGLTDVAVTEVVTDSVKAVKVVTNAGGRSFDPPVTLNLPHVPQHISAGDVDGDGRAELAVAVDEAVISVVSLDEQGALGRSDIPIEHPASAVQFGDATGDGEVDLVFGYSRGGVFILGNQGDGTLELEDEMHGGFATEDLVVEDLTADGRNDIAASNFWYSVSVFIHNPGGSMTRPESYDLGLSNGLHEWGDVNGDGMVDLVDLSADELRVFLASGDGTFAAGPSSSHGPLVPRGSLLADVTGDDVLDLIASDQGKVITWVGEGDGGFGASETYEFVDPAAGSNDTYGAVLAVGGFGGDSDRDLFLFTNKGSSFIFEGEGDGTFSSHEAFVETDPIRDAAVADMDGNGSDDLVTTEEGLQDLCVYLQSAGTFTEKCVFVAAGRSSDIALYDADRDGDMDVLDVRSERRMAILLNDGDGDFPSVQQRETGGWFPESISVGDLNMDGWDDVAVGSSDGAVSVLYQEGSGLGSPQHVGSSPVGLLTIGDVDGDARPDIPYTLPPDHPRADVAVIFNETQTGPVGAPRREAPGTPFTQGVFSLDWIPGSGVASYELQKKDANDSSFTKQADAAVNRYDFNPGASIAEGTWRFRVVPDGNTSNASKPSAPIVVDKTPPAAATFVPDRQPAATVNGVGWWKDSVTIEVQPGADPALADGSPGSGVPDANVPAPRTFSTTGKRTLTAAPRDRSRNAPPRTELTFGVDAHAPALSAPCDVDEVNAGQQASIDWTATDQGSGLSTPASGAVALNTSTVGKKSVEIPDAVDNVGHVTEGPTCEYEVFFDWEPRGQMVERVDGDETRNVVPAGKKIAVRFSLGGAFGLDVFSTKPWAALTPCATGVTNKRITAFSKSTSGRLTYSKNSQVYTYTWTPKGRWVGTCRLLRLRLDDGTEHQYETKVVKR